MMATRNLMRPLSLAVIAALATAGCAPVHMQGALKGIGRPVEADGFAAARHNPLSSAAHYATAMGFLDGPSVTRGDLEMALSGFQTAARLAPDLWEPLAGAAVTSYELGNVREAMNLMAQAIERRGSPGPLAVPLALLAYRAGEPEFARLVFSKADRTENADAVGLNFLDAAFAGTGWRPTSSSPSLSDSTVVQSNSPSAATTATDSGQGVVIEAYLIRETRTSVGNRGFN